MLCTLMKKNSFIFLFLIKAQRSRLYDSIEFFCALEFVLVHVEKLKCVGLIYSCSHC